MLTEVFLPHLNRTVKLGRLQSPTPAVAALKFEDYSKALPPPPPTIDYSANAMQSLQSIYMNDQLGCCVISGGYHYLGTITGNAGALFNATDAQIITDYGKIGGYVPGRPRTDQGCNLQDAMNYWMKYGFANGSKLAGWVALDATNKNAVMTALDLFENCYFGIGLPNQWINNPPQQSGFIWDVAGRANSNNGHCVTGLGYDSTGVKFDTWGLLGTMTWAAVADYAVDNSGGELYVMISDAMLNKAQAKAPNGFDWFTLVNDFNLMGGSVPVPAPPTPPPPLITPTGVIMVDMDGMTASVSGNIKIVNGTGLTIDYDPQTNTVTIPPTMKIVNSWFM